MLLKTFNKNIIYSFDIDGVIANTANVAIKLFNKKFKQNKKVTDLKSFFIVYDWLLTILNDKDLAMAEMVKVWNDDRVLFGSKPIKGAIELTKNFHEKGLRVHYITSRPGSAREITIAWFRKWLPWVNPENIHISSSVNGLQRSYKLETIKTFLPDIHFEDSIEHAKDIAGILPATKVVLVRQPWNYSLNSLLPKSIIVPKGKFVKRNLMASYDYYLQNI